MKNGYASPTKAGVGKAEFHGSGAKFHHPDPIFHVKRVILHPYFAQISWVFHASFITKIHPKALVLRHFSNENACSLADAKKTPSGKEKSPFFPLVLSLLCPPLMGSVKAACILPEVV